MKFTRGFDDYVGLDRVDDRYAVSAALTYKLTRERAAQGRDRREWLHSNVARQRLHAPTSFLLGVRLQR